MIVKNEEHTLKRCLNSVKTAVDEIIIVDTGSIDRTKKTAAEFTDKVFDFKWVNDFSAARNYSFSKATMDYILWLDADDVFLPEDIVKFLKLKEDLDADISTVMLKYNTGFDKDGNVTFSFFRERLVKRSLGFKWREPVHEYIETWGKTLREDICVTHTKRVVKQDARNLNIYESLLQKGEELSPRGIYYYARELRDAGRNLDAVKYFNLFLSGGNGWVEDNIAACSALYDCYVSLSEYDNALKSLFKSFEYDNPRAEICCKLGYYFKEKKLFKQAAFWFKLALNAEKTNLGFCLQDYLGYIPYIELAVCYHQLGDSKKAFEYNEKAAEFKPNSIAVLNNREFFKGIFKP